MSYVKNDAACHEAHTNVKTTALPARYIKCEIEQDK